MTTAAVVGARGYLGREVLRLLADHPHVDTVRPVSGSRDGPVATAVPGLAATGMSFTTFDDAKDCDVAFLSVPGGAAAGMTKDLEDAGCKHIIDLSRDHRLDAIEGGAWHYGLADIDPPAKGTARVANPGCYPTSMLVPLRALQMGGVTNGGRVIVDGKSGLSGAGVQARDDLHFPEANESVRAYAVDGHDHMAEMSGMAGVPVRFTPHLVPQTRGLLTTTYVESDATQEDVNQALDTAFANQPFVDRVEEPNTAHVRGTNRLVCAAHVQDGLVTIRSAIDNLIKGGAGQAIQNMNHVLGERPETGLPTLGMT